jgi:uncharacterized repeat protein (TIGR03847 family)
MSHEVIDLDPAEQITVDAVGELEDYTFVLQGSAGRQLVSLVLEREQVLALALAGSELLEILDQEYGRELDQLQIPVSENMSLQAPVEPLFQIAQFQLGYDAERDYLVIIAVELPSSIESDGLELAVVRFWLSREQMVALIRRIETVIANAPPLCPACGEPMDPLGHRCIRNN